MGSSLWLTTELSSEAGIISYFFFIHVLVSEIMYAFSPGLWSDNGHAWSLVAVDTMKGAVKKQCDIAPPGKSFTCFFKIMQNSYRKSLFLLFYCAPANEVSRRYSTPKLISVSNFRHEYIIITNDTDQTIVCWSILYWCFISLQYPVSLVYMYFFNITIALFGCM